MPLNKKANTDKPQQSNGSFQALSNKKLKTILKQSCKDQMKIIKQAEKIAKAEKQPVGKKVR